MAAPGRIPGLIVTGLMIAFGIIHFGAGIGVTARYQRYRDIFRPSVGLSAYNIVIGIYAFAIGIVCLVGILKERPALSKTGVICSAVLFIIVLASFIAALTINKQAVGYIRGRLTYHVNSYIATDDSINIIDTVQTTYQCCGVNLWLDWASSSLGATSGTGVGTGTGINTGIGRGLDTNTDTAVGRRRRYLDLVAHRLVKNSRKRRQIVIGSGTYGLPTTYSVNLPLSCCKGGGTSAAPNTIGGYCTFNAGNSSNGFYVEGCIVPVANIMVFQITGIAIMNVFLIILAIIIIPILIYMFPVAFDQSNPYNKQPLSDQREEERQNQNGGYYNNNPIPGAYYNYSQPMYMTTPVYSTDSAYATTSAYTVEPVYIAPPTYPVQTTYGLYQ